MFTKDEDYYQRRIRVAEQAIRGTLDAYEEAVKLGDAIVMGANRAQLDHLRKELDQVKSTYDRFIGKQLACVDCHNREPYPVEWSIMCQNDQWYLEGGYRCEACQRAKDDQVIDYNLGGVT